MTEQESPRPEPSSRPRSNLWLESRYRKLRRGLPQTVFFCPKCKGDRRRRVGCKTCEGFGKLTRESVQELIARRLLPAMQAKAGVFHGAGREDIDVLMLGRGRPFVFEVQGAREPNVDLEALRLDIMARAEGALELAPFVRVPRARVAYWKETHFDKIYRAEVGLAGPLPPAGLLAAQQFAGTILQRTPQRVAHRRADLERPRNLRVLSLLPMQPPLPTSADAAPDAANLRLELRVVCQHGTYVKEWISGDETRTSPSLATLLGVGCRCEVLDVEEIMTDDIEGPRVAPADATAVPQAGTGS
jgi:tRNA pseudouridine synthase 10